MKILITINELKVKACRELIPLECEVCKNTFYKPKNLVLRGLKGTRKISVCSGQCKGKLISKHLKTYYTNPNKSYDNRVNTLKKELIILLGGKCEICGYDKCLSSLLFHHIKPNEKSFKITEGMVRKFPKEKLIEEIKKCMLLCGNCHGEMHEGLISPTHRE